MAVMFSVVSCMVSLIVGERCPDYLNRHCKYIFSGVTIGVSATRQFRSS